jgi:hypothetical protein
VSEQGEPAEDPDHRRTPNFVNRHAAAKTRSAAGPLRVDVPGEEIADLQRRVAVTRWPSPDLVADRSQGVQPAMIQELTRYWAADYDWRKC